MADPLSSFYVKLDRADKYAKEVDTKVTRYLASQPYRILRKDDLDAGKRVYHVHVTRTPPEAWSGVIGDCIHNLRAVLDHLAFAVVARYGKTSKDTSFPIQPRRTAFRGDYQSKIGRTRVGGGLPGLRKDIESLQPYYRTNGNPFLDPLWVLHRMDIADKHRALLALSVGRGAAVNAPFGEPIYNVDPTYGPIKKGAELARVEVFFPRPGDTVEVEVVPDLDVVISGVGLQPGGAGGGWLTLRDWPLPRTLWVIREAVYVAVKAMEPYLN